MAFPARQAHVEALLRERQLDRTLTTALPAAIDATRVAPFGVAAVDDRLHGGIPRGQVSEVIGPVSSGRTSLAWTWLGAATQRAESVALIDTFDRFDPTTGAACGIDLARLLWVRGQAVTKTSAAVDPTWLPGARTVDGPGTLLERTIDRALKALNLVLQSGVCTAVVLDFADVPLAGIRRVPQSTWLRLQRVVEGSDTACLLLGPVPLSRSAGGVTVMTSGASSGATGCEWVRTGAPGATTGCDWVRTGALGAHRCAGCDGVRTGALGATGRVRTGAADATGRTGATGVARWAGSHDRSRRLAGLHVSARMASPRRMVEGTAALNTVIRHELIE